MASDKPGVPPMIARAQGIERIAEALVAGTEPGWSELRYRVQATAAVRQSQLRVVRDGVETQPLPPREADSTAKTMRGAMFQPGKGTWFSMSVTVTDAGKVSTDFNYDEDPQFDPPIDPIAFVLDQEKFPRDPHNQPEWLRERIAEGEARRAEHNG
jgi:hypothetical protein